MSEFTKKCFNPDCETIQIYSSKDALQYALKNNSKCRKCACKKTEEHKNKISIANKKYWETTNIVEHMGGHEQYEHWRVTHSNKLKGKKRPPFSEEWKFNMGESRRNSEVYQNWMKSDEYRETRRKIAVNNYHDDLTYEDWLLSTDDRKIYYSQVWFHTNKQPLHLLENYEKRGNATTDPDAYHVDHIVPISYGFKHQIDPEIIGHFSNLQMLPWLENILKSNKYEGQNENNGKTDID